MCSLYFKCTVFPVVPSERPSALLWRFIAFINKAKIYWFILKVSQDHCQLVYKNIKQQKKLFFIFFYNAFAFNFLYSKNFIKDDITWTSVLKHFTKLSADNDDLNATSFNWIRRSLLFFPVCEIDWVFY